MYSQTYEIVLLKEGPGEFEIDMIADRDANGSYYTSKAGDRMIKVRLHVVDGNGDVDSVWLNIVHKHLYNLRDLCEAVGMSNVYKEYKQGHQVLEELIGKEGRCELVIKRDEQYGDRTEVKKFIAKNRNSITSTTTSVPSPQKTEMVEDRIPF